MIMSAVLLAVSCNDNNDNIGEATIKVGQKSVNVSAEGGKIAIDYSIEGKYDGELYIGQDADWIKLDEIGKSTIFFDIATNTSEEARTATLSLHVKGAENVYVLIVQSGKTAGFVNEEMFAIEVSDITTGTATVSVTPKEEYKTKTYLYSVIDKKSYETYGSRAYIEACIRQIDEFVELSLKYDPVPRSFSDFLSRYASVNPATLLHDDTEYYAAAFDLDVNKQFSGNITLKEFKTQKTKQSSNKFNLRMNGSVLTVTPTNNDPYIYDILTKEAWSEFSTPREVAQMFVQTMKSYGYLSIYIVNGAQSEDFASTLDHSGNYVAYAFGYNYDDRTGGITTEIEYIEFSYKASAASATGTGQGRMSLTNTSALRPMILAR